MTVTDLIHLEAEQAVRRRFFARVAVSDSGCWIWTGAQRKGYGDFDLHGKRWSAHRFAYELLIGPIPSGLVLDHLCETTLCVNPGHLEPVTIGENTRRGSAGRRNNWQRRKTTCPHGHPYDEANTYVWRSLRICRACRRGSRKQGNRGPARVMRDPGRSNTSTAVNSGAAPAS